jgi:hypothetical protein
VQLVHRRRLRGDRATTSGAGEEEAVSTCALATVPMSSAVTTWRRGRPRARARKTRLHGLCHGAHAFAWSIALCGELGVAVRGERGARDHVDLRRLGALGLRDEDRDRLRVDLSSRRSVFGYCGTDTSVICPPDTVIATCTAP